MIVNLALLTLMIAKAICILAAHASAIQLNERHWNTSAHCTAVCNVSLPPVIETARTIVYLEVSQACCCKHTFKPMHAYAWIELYKADH